MHNVHDCQKYCLLQSFLNGNKHAKADCLPSSSNSVMMKNMALLLRTIMAATVEQELRQFGARYVLQLCL